jgi:hypothetical protein
VHFFALAEAKVDVYSTFIPVSETVFGIFLLQPLPSVFPTSGVNAILNGMA